ncbi:MAG: TRAP transporter TatT component family protein [Spirochaetaceae bacterium]|jgi:hypothetical protein|nr:TRAP transporter TatT component family protein [Spirochaetaceae bacterium]
MKKSSFVLYLFPLLVGGLSCAACASSPVVVGFVLPRMIDGDEGKLAKDPADDALRLKLGSYYVMYANAFVQGPAEMLPASEYEKRDAEKRRAKGLYLRGVELLRDGFDRRHPGVNDAYTEGTLDVRLAELTKDDAALVYWLVAGSLAAFSIDPLGELQLGLRLPELGALIARAYELDPDFNNGAIDDFYILYYGSLPDGLGRDWEKARVHYERAIAKSGGVAASPYVSWAQAIAIPSQDYPAFEENLTWALAVDNGKCKTSEEKLANKIAQKKARYLLENADLFIIRGDGDYSEGP